MVIYIAWAGSSAKVSNDETNMMSVVETVRKSGRVTSGFDPYAYLALNPDLCAAFGADVTKAINHYVSTGWAEGRPTKGFDAWSYLAFNPDLYNAFGADLGAAVAHYVNNGANEDRPLLGFNPYAYLAQNADLFAAFGADPAKALDHYVRHGLSEGRLIAGFDPYAYLALNSDLYNAFGMNISAAISHYINNGAAEGRTATGFNPYAYLAQNADLFAAFGADPAKAVQHYVQSGSHEGDRAATAGLPVAATTPPTLSIAASSASKNEGNSATTPFTFTVTRSGDTTVSTTVNWAVSGSAVNAADFSDGTLPSGAITFAKGETSKPITLNVRDDTTYESNEAFTVTLSNPSGSARLGTAGALAFTTVDLTPPSLASTNPANGTASVPVSANIVLTFNEAVKAGSGSITIANKTAGGSRTIAVTDTSQVSFSGSTLTITPTTDLSGSNQMEVTFGAGVVKDAAGNSFVGVGPGVLKFTTDYVPPVISIAATDSNKFEGNSGTTPFTFTVTRTGDLTRASSMSWATKKIGDNPTMPSNFSLSPSDTLEIAIGETTFLKIQRVKGGADVAPDEIFQVKLVGTSSHKIGTTKTVINIKYDDKNEHENYILHIINNDSSPIKLDASIAFSPSGRNIGRQENRSVMGVYRHLSSVALRHLDNENTQLLSKYSHENNALYFYQHGKINTRQPINKLTKIRPHNKYKRTEMSMPTKYLDKEDGWKKLSPPRLALTTMSQTYLTQN